MISAIKGQRFFFLSLLLGMAVRMVMASGVASPDSYFFTQHAADLLRGKFNMGIQNYVDFYRYVVWMPISFFFHLFGISDFSATLWPFLCGMGCLVVIYLLGELLFDRKIALLALFIYSFLSLEVITATQILSDIMVEFFSALAVLIFLRQEIKYPDKRGAINYLLVGISLGVAVNARPLAAVLGIFFMLYLLRKRRLKWTHGLIIAGVMSILGLTCVVAWWQTGDAFFEYRVMNNFFEELHLASQTDPAYQYYAERLLSGYYLKSLLGLTRFGLANFSFFFYVFLAALIFCMARRRKEAIEPLLWIIPTFLYMQFGFVNLRQLLPIAHEERYLTILTIPSVLLVAFSLRQWVKEGKRLRLYIAGLLLFIFALTSLYGAYRIKKNLLTDTRPYKAVYAYLQDKPQKPIYCISQKWPLFLNYYFRYTMDYDFFENIYGGEDSLLRLVHNISDPRQIKNAYLVLHDRYIHFDDYGHPLNKRGEVPAYIYYPPANWKLLQHFEFSGKGNKVDIYLAPN